MLCSFDTSTIAGPTSENKQMDLLQSSMELVMEAMANGELQTGGSSIEM